MKYSEDRIKNLAYNIHDKLYMNNEVDYPDDEKALAHIKDIMLKYFAIEDHVDAAVRTRISSLKREVPIGSSEWNILYEKYTEEELKKTKF